MSGFPARDIILLVVVGQNSTVYMYHITQSFVGRHRLAAALSCRYRLAAALSCMRAAVKMDASVSPGHVHLVVDGSSRCFILVLRHCYAESHSGWTS